MTVRFALLVGLLCSASAVTAQAPTPIDTGAARKAMEKLHFLVGDWAGEASAVTGPGQQIRMWQTEWIRPKVKGQVLAVEGVGRRLTPAGPADTLFNAWATIDWTPERGYLMRSRTLDGRAGEFPVTVLDSGFVWGMKFPQGEVRYTMRILPSGEWHEKGEYSRDGTQWFPMVEMHLKRLTGQEKLTR